MCKSVKGAAFFGSSIHVVASFVFLCWFLFDTVITEMGINLFRCVLPDDDPPRKYSLLVHYLNMFFKFLYYITMSVTGIYIFRGVERASPKIIKYALLIFVITQVIGLALFVSVSFTYWEEETAEITSSRLVASEELIENGSEIGINGTESFENDEAIIPVLESPLTSTTTTPEPDPPHVIIVKVPVKVPYDNYNRSKLSHNQLVNVVFQILLVVFNAVGSIIYSIVMTFYLLTL